MRYKVMTAAVGLLLLAGCDDPKPSNSARDVTEPSPMSGSSAQQGTVARENPGNTMMMQSGGNNGNAQTMMQGSGTQGVQPQAQRIGPRGEPTAGTQPAPTTPSPTSPVPGQQ